MTSRPVVVHRRFAMFHLCLLSFLVFGIGDKVEEAIASEDEAGGMIIDGG